MVWVLLEFPKNVELWKEQNPDPDVTMQALICPKGGPKDREGAAVSMCPQE